jgi:hypothetical protein
VEANEMIHIITGTMKFDRDYVRFLHEYLSKKSWAEILKEAIVFDDSYITDYDIFESVADFACKNMINRIAVKSGGRYSSLEYYKLEFTPSHRFYYHMMKGWTYDLNKYVMSKFDGNWVYIPKNKYTL